MLTKIILSIVLVILSLLLSPKFSDNSVLQIIISLVIPAIIGYFMGGFIHSSSKHATTVAGSVETKSIPLRRKITYVGLVLSILIGFKIAMLGYMAVAFGLSIIVAGPLVSYLLGILVEIIRDKRAGKTTT